MIKKTTTSTAAAWPVTLMLPHMISLTLEVPVLTLFSTCFWSHFSNNEILSEVFIYLFSNTFCQILVKFIIFLKHLSLFSELCFHSFGFSCPWFSTPILVPFHPNILTFNTSHTNHQDTGKFLFFFFTS